MNTLTTVLKSLAVLVLLGVTGFILYQQAEPLLTPPCTKPIAYRIGSIDERFGVSESVFTQALTQAAQVWNTEAGRIVFTPATAESRDVLEVHLVYSDIQRATELGSVIQVEQEAYDAKKAEVARVKEVFAQAKAQYEKKAAVYEEQVAAYDRNVQYWNERGGAPEEEYARLREESRALESARILINSEADQVNALGKKVNTAVEELNAIAEKVNAKVRTYNQKAGEDYEQGNYISDEKGQRIEVYEMKDTADLERVLTHEFGHALGLDHVENPESLMYSFNFGEGLALSEEDKAEFRRVCKLDTP